MPFPLTRTNHAARLLPTKLKPKPVKPTRQGGYLRDARRMEDEANGMVDIRSNVRFGYDVW